MANIDYVQLVLNLGLGEEFAPSLADFTRKIPPNDTRTFTRGRDNFVTFRRNEDGALALTDKCFRKDKLAAAATAIAAAKAKGLSDAYEDIAQLAAERLKTSFILFPEADQKKSLVVVDKENVIHLEQDAQEVIAYWLMAAYQDYKVKDFRSEVIPRTERLLKELVPNVEINETAIFNDGEVKEHWFWSRNPFKNFNYTGKMADPHEKWFAFQTEEARKAIIHFIGSLAFLGSDMKEYLILQGQTNSGKTMLAEGLVRLLGPSAALFELGQVESRFRGAELFKKRLAVIDEANSNDYMSEDSFKSLVNGSRLMRHEAKGRPVYTVPACTKFILTANQVPTISNEADEMRMVFVQLSDRGVDKRDKDLGFERAFTDESALQETVAYCMHQYKNAAKVPTPKPIYYDEIGIVKGYDTYQDDVEHAFEVCFKKTANPAEYVPRMVAKQRLKMFLKNSPRKILALAETKLKSLSDYRSNGVRHGIEGLALKSIVE